jgi:ankyrin repeat protein
MGYCKIKLARILVENGADINAENNHGMTPLHILTKRKFRTEVMFSISRYCY